MYIARLAPLLAAALTLLACRSDPPPPQTAANRPAPTTIAPPRQATLPAPTISNALIIGVQLRAEAAWNDATLAETSEAWDLAADLFARARDACTSDCGELAYATVLARAKALDADPTSARPEDKPTEPQPLPPRVEALIDAADVYVASASPGDDDAIGVSFLAGRQFDAYGWIDESTTRFATIVLAHPAHDVALYSANLLLDALNRSGRYDELVRWARDMSANAALMAAHTELAELVAEILARAARAK